MLGQSRVAYIMTICLLSFSGCASGTTSVHSREVTATPLATTTPSTLLHFSDWRAAYLAPDGRAHIVTLDGKTDMAGPLLPDLRPQGLVIANAGVGSDGKTLAYSADAGLDLVDLTSQKPPHSVQIQGAFNNILWSPDQSKLYSAVGAGQFFYVTLATGQATNLTPGHGIEDELGWIDKSHLAAESSQGVSYWTDPEGDKLPTSDTLVSLDITTDEARTITTVQSNGPTGFRFVISPDGSQALYDDAPIENLKFTPQVALINLATGQVTPLPTIAKATGADFSRVAWRPGTNTIAVSTGYAENSDLQTWLLDVSADTATSIGSLGHPMGWAPNNGPLVLSSGWQSTEGEGPYTLTAVTCASGGQCSTTTLTTQAIDFTFLGFVRNP